MGLNTVKSETAIYQVKYCDRVLYQVIFFKLIITRRS